MKATRNLSMRLLCMVLVLLCMIHTVLPASAAPAEEEHAEVFYTSKVYYKASTASFVIGHFENGTELIVLEESGNFYKVDCYDMTGFIAKDQVVVENERYYVNCNTASGDTGEMSYVSLTEALIQRATLMNYANEKLGCRYRHGAGGPTRFDCSGYTSFVYGQIGYDLFRGSQAQLEDGVIISSNGLQVGDLLFYRGTHRRNYVTHVAIYAGDGKMIHADSRGVIYTDLNDEYYASRFVCARRVINVSAAQAEQVATPSVHSVLTRGNATMGLR